MANPESHDDDAAAIAQEQIIRTVVSVGAQLAVLLAANWVYLHADDIKDRARALAAIARRRPSRLPPDAALQVCDFARTVSAYDHGER